MLQVSLFKKQAYRTIILYIQTDPLHAPLAHSWNACALLGILNPNIEAAFPATPGPGATHHQYSVYHLLAPPCRLAAFVTTAYAQR
ncbi:hypothetical protein GMG22_20485 [Salmonella enterica]|nr:hypothetical protein [Salmonella enterica]